MSSVTVCARFRPLSSKEKRDHGDKICIRSLDSETFVFQDDKEEDFTFGFDRVFYPGSEQADVYEFLALPIVQDAVNAINGTIITYGQTGAGKTYSMEGLGILECHGQQKGLLPRAVDGLFECLKLVDEMTNYTVKLSMVEIYMEKVRDLFDLSKDNLQIKEGKVQGIFLSGVTEISISDTAEALRSLSNGLANRAVGETQMNMASSRSHCVYIFTVRLESARDTRVKTGKLILVDLAGSEKVEKTGAEGRVLEEAKTINKSLSALGNVINALTNGAPGKSNHIPYRDSKLTRILQDALGGNSRTALLCCCSPSPLNASESLSTLRFGARAKLIKTTPRVFYSEDKVEKKQLIPSPIKDDSCERILNKLREKMNDEDVKLLEELFIMEGIIFNPNSVDEFESAYEDITFRTISSLHQAVEELTCNINKLKRQNKALKAKVAAAERINVHRRNAEGNVLYSDWISVGAPNFQRGCNFATGGATILPATAASGSPFSFGVQVSQFRRFKARVLDLLAHDKKLENFLPSKESFSQGLYMFDIGQNDLDGKFYSKSENEVVALIPTFISELETGIKRLYDQGARKFWIHNTGPLGCLPRIIAVFGRDPSSLDEFGCVSSHNRAAKFFNSQLSTLRKNFQRNFTDAYVTYIDVFSIKLNLISNFSHFGFEHSTTACCGYGGLPLNYDSRIQCGETKNLNGSLVAAKPCNNTAEYVNWDGNHYTEAANLYISSQILTGEYLDPRPENISLPYYMFKL